MHTHLNQGSSRRKEALTSTKKIGSLLTSAAAAVVLAFAFTAHAHLIGDESHDHGRPRYDFSVQPPLGIVLGNHDVWERRRLAGEFIPSDPPAGRQRSQEMAAPVLLAAANDTVPSASRTPVTAAPFQAFAGKVRVRWDDQFLYVESAGMPAHNMMVGITAWQQQVPLPQPYTGNNAWRIPLQPVPSKSPASIKGRFLRGAIALAANGIPIFNPQNNRGEVSQEIGELDQWGGHCGRADDYHYHAAPLHLQSVLGRNLPIAYALDGYPIYGLAEPDGSAPAKLDSFNGHETAALGYHYHSSTKYPYVNGGFHGEMVEAGGQVDPQPRAQPMREAGAPLRGARITGFTSQGKSYSLKYELGSETRYVNYVLNDNGTVKFDFVDGRGQVKSETYSPRQRGPGGGGGDRPPGDSKGKGGRKKGQGKGSPRPDGNRESGPRSEANREGGRPGDRADARPARNESASAAPLILTPKRSGNFVLHSAVVTDGGALPTEFTGDGSGSTLPLDWNGAPAGTKSYALIMDHLAPGNVMKCYWTLWDIPANVARLPKNVKGIGKLGPSFQGQIGYQPPHSQGPGLKTYVLTVYALSAPPRLSQPAREVTREVLLTAIQDSILDSAELKVTYTRPGAAGGKKKEAKPK